MELLQFDDLSLFKSILLDEETLIINSKCGKYSFYINFKDEIKGVDYYELAIVTQDSEGFINKSGTAKIIKQHVLDTLKGKVGDNLIDDNKLEKNKNPFNKKRNNSSIKNNGSIYMKKRR